MNSSKFTAIEGFIFIAISITSFVLVTSFHAISISLVWAIFFGLAFGSFATSFVARIPRGIIYQKKDPYCMSCKTPLERRDLYTIFSYIANKGQCRFCGMVIPKSIFSTEVMVTIAYVIAYFQYGFGWEYVFWSSIYFVWIITIQIIAK